MIQKHLNDHTIIVAPLKGRVETQSSLLMQPSHVRPKDNKKQIVVKLPLKDFLCYIQNGRLTRWGIIVAQDEKATGNMSFHLVLKNIFFSLRIVCPVSSICSI